MQKGASDENAHNEYACMQGISNTCDEGVCGKEWWPQDHKEMVHGHEMMIIDAHEMMIMVIKHEEMDIEQSDQSKGIIIGFAFTGLR
jgi:hypothetical protein